MEFEEIINFLEENKNPEFKKGMERVGIKTPKAYGIKLPILRKLTKEIGKNHELAIKLWEYGTHETYLLATLIEEEEKVTKKQIQEWTNKFYSWDIVDQCCINLYRKIPYAIENIFSWATSDKEFVKRTAFSLIAVLAVHNKKEPASYFDKYYPILINESTDKRNYVKKSISWALRSIGKRDEESNNNALKCTYEIEKIDNKTSKWIAKDVIKELKSEKVQNKIKSK